MTDTEVLHPMATFAAELGVAFSPGVWCGVAAPFRMLDPGLQSAEAMLAGADNPCGRVASLIRSVARALPDLVQATDLLNQALAITTGAPRLRELNERWLVAVDGHTGPVRQPGRTDAAMMLAVLVAATGWQRVKGCEHARCQAAFVDRTMGHSGRYCAAHRRKTGSRRPR